MDCNDCRDDFDHCHELLVLHIDGTPECIDPKCSGHFDIHEWEAFCLDLNWGCDCSRIGHAQPLAA